MQREKRYIVLKCSDVEAAASHGFLNHYQMDALVGITSRVTEYRQRAKKPTLECVVVEADWPEYEATWRAIERRVDAVRLEDSEWSEVDLWAEIHRLRAAIKGPDGFASWQDAATSERVRRVRAEKAAALASVLPARHEPPNVEVEPHLAARTGCDK
jgi:hypothetical protein